MDHPGYFGGSTVRDGMVRRLQATTFKELVEVINVPIHIQLTRKEFLAHPEKNTIKDGLWVSPCAYDYEVEGKRGNAHATQQVLLCFDFDGGKFAGDFDRNRETLRMHLHPFNYVCWRTASYTGQDPHLRLVVEVVPFSPEHLRRYIQFLCKSLGAPPDFKGVVETSTISQPAYRPVKFKNEEFTAVLASRTDGRALQESDLPDPAEELAEVMGEKTYGSKHTDLTDLGLAYMPLASVTLEDFKDALSAIDPDCDYRTWLTVCAAARHQFPDEADAREAHDAFDEWSSGGTKYRGRGETWAKWKSFKPYAEGRAPVTIRSLFKLAIEAGWNSSKAATRHRGTVDEWIAGCEDPEELMQEGPERIVSLPFRNEVVEEDLVVLLQDRIKELNGRRLEKRVIYREMSKARRRDKAQDREKLTTEPPAWLRPICYVSAINQFHNFGNSTGTSPEAFNNTYSPELMPKDGAEVALNGKPAMTPSDYARNIVGIPIVDDVMYYPLHQGEDPFFKIDGKSYLNLYNPMTVPIATPDRAEEAGAMVTRLVDAIVAEVEYREVLLDYMAVPVKWPGRKVPWGTLIQSEEGAGKNYLGDVMSGALGHPNVRIVDATTICDKWNDFHTQGCVWCIINELLIPGERREKVTNMIKPLITDPIITINEKYRSARNIPNFVNYMVFTNFRDAIHLKPGDRRWFVIFSKLQTKAQIVALTNTGIFKDLESLKNELSGALRYWLLHREIAKDFPFDGPPPVTKYRQMIIDDSTNPLQEAIEDILRHKADPMVQDDVLSAWHLTSALPHDMRKQYTRVSHYLHALGYEKFRDRSYVNGHRSDVWIHADRFITGIGDPVDVLEWRGKAAGDIVEI